MEDSKDLISRQAAIDAFKSIPTINGLGLQPLITVDAAISTLNGLTSAQPEIIRCKDCGKQRVCRFSQYQGDNGFCSLAARKEE